MAKHGEVKEIRKIYSAMSNLLNTAFPKTKTLWPNYIKFDELSKLASVLDSIRIVHSLLWNIDKNVIRKKTILDGFLSFEILKIKSAIHNARIDLGVLFSNDEISEEVFNLCMDDLDDLDAQIDGLEELINTNIIALAEKLKDSNNEYGR